MKKASIWEVFWSFFKIGAFTFGGGYAMIPIMQKEVVEKKHWATDDDIVKLLVISESTPGVMAVNSATFIGYKVAGFWGSTLATLGVVLPSFIVIAIISGILTQFETNYYVRLIFLGVKAGVAILILNAALKLSRKLKRNIFTFSLIIAAFLIALFTTIDIILVLIVGATLGIIYGALSHDKYDVGGIE